MTATQPVTDVVVAVRDVFVGFRAGANAVMALRGIDLDLAAGERLVVQGPNGSGKSTLLRVITGEQPVLAGGVEVGGAALHRMDAAARRRWRVRSVGFIDQHARRGLLPERTVLDNVGLPLRLAGVSARAARRRARETLAALHLEPLATRPVAELSGGEAQRVAACVAVVHEPALILADEPTGELDDAAAREVYDLLAAVAARGTGIILVSHDARSLAFADRAVRIRDGRTAEQWWPGSEREEQLPDSRGWVRIPVERLPRLGPLGGLVARPAGHGLRLDPPHAATVEAPPPAPVRVVTPEVAGIRARLAGVVAGFGAGRLFDDLDLEIMAGSWTAVSGPSGSGKSTLLSLLAGLIDPLAGEVSVEDVAWRALSRAERAEHRRRWLALAPQRATLVEALTVRENLALPAALRRSSLPGSELDELADRLALTSLLEQPVHTLSGGERQRTGVGRVLMTRASLLVFDEPTSQQDDVSAGRVRQALRAEAAAGRAVVVASHDEQLLTPSDSRIVLGAASS